MNEEMKDVTAGVRGGLRGVMGCLGDVHCLLKGVVIAARWSASFCGIKTLKSCALESTE